MHGYGISPFKQTEYHCIHSASDGDSDDKRALMTGPKPSPAPPGMPADRGVLGQGAAGGHLQDQDGGGRQEEGGHGQAGGCLFLKANPKCNPEYWAGEGLDFKFETEADSLKKEVMDKQVGGSSLFLGCQRI